MNAAKKNIDDSFKKAIKEEKHNYEIINDEFVDDSKSLLVEWGCNEECVHKLNISLSSTAHFSTLVKSTKSNGKFLLIPISTFSI